jgi:hypothetical protein
VVEASAQPYLIIDEIQRAQALLSLIHALIEENKLWRFILTGSSYTKQANISHGHQQVKNNTESDNIPPVVEK